MLYHTSCIYSFRKEAQEMAYLRRSRSFCGMFLVLYAILSTVETSECSYSNGRHYCYDVKHCCAKRKVCRDNCLGDSCTLSSDCAPGEYCCDRKCASNCPTCTHSLQCSLGETCCDRDDSFTGKCSKSCVGKSCKYFYNCAVGECCGPNGTCALSCIGEKCLSNNACATNEFCCSSYKITSRHSCLSHDIIFKTPLRSASTLL